MATSGSYGFSPRIAEIIDQAFSKLQIDAATIGAQHITSASFNLSMMLASWGNLGGQIPWALEQTTQALTDGDAEFDCPAATIDVLTAVLRREGSDIPMGRMNRDEYLYIVDKDLEGLPNTYWVNRKQETVTVTLWPVPENSTDTMIYTRLRHLQEPGAISNTLEVPQTWIRAVVYGLASEMAPDFAPAKLSMVQPIAARAKEDALEGSRTRSSVFIGPALRRGRRWS